MIIFAGIVARFPEAIVQTIQSCQGRRTLIFFVILLVVVMVLRLSQASYLSRRGQRKIPVQYAKRIVGKKMFGGQSTHLAAEDQYGGRYTPDICVIDHNVSGDYCRIYSHTMGAGYSQTALVRIDLLHSVIYVGLIFFFRLFLYGGHLQSG